MASQKTAYNSRSPGSDPSQGAAESVKQIVEDYLRNRCSADLESLTPLQRLQTIMRLMAYLLPHLKSVDLNMERPIASGGIATLFTGKLNPPDTT